MAALALTAAVLSGCAGGGDDGGLVVFADPALREVAKAVDPEAAVVVARPSELADRIRTGSDADVLLTANAKPFQELQADGLVEAPVAFASNQLVIIVPRRNRAEVTHIVDLTRKGVRIALGAEGVSIGDLARQSLELAGLGAANDNVVSLEPTAQDVIDQVVQAKVDAAIVYATDVGPVGAQVQAFEISPYFQPEIRYDAAAVTPASDEATAYLERLNGDPGFEAVVRAGLVPAPS